MLAKHGTVDICDGSSGAVGEFSHHPGINQTRQATDKGMFQQKWEQIQQEENTGWKPVFVGTQQWDEDAMQGF